MKSVREMIGRSLSIESRQGGRGSRGFHPPPASRPSIFFLRGDYFLDVFGKGPGGYVLHRAHHPPFDSGSTRKVLHSPWDPY